MTHRTLRLAAAFAATVAVLLLAQSPVFGQAAAPTATAPSGGKAWTPPHTPDGQPDLQGVWTNNTLTPLTRPKRLAGKEFYTEAELTDLVQKERARVSRNQEEGPPTEPGTADDVHYDFSQFGLDRDFD
jgi:hypothetical protein